MLRTDRIARLLAGLVPALLLALPVRAELAVDCAWPPPGGPAILPESTDVMMTPIVGDLDGDGLPEIVIVTFIDVNDPNRGEDGVLRVLSGADCSELWSLPDPGLVSCFGDPAPRSLDERADPGVFCPACGVAIGDLDDDGDLEIVALAEGLPRPDGADPADETEGFPRRVVVIDHEGNFVSCSEASPTWLGHLAAPAIGDLDGDGTPELVTRTSAFNLDGSLRWAAPLATGQGPSLIADLDEDGSAELISGEAVYEDGGAVRWDRSGDLPPSFAAIGDLNLDCLPEIVLTATERAELLVLDPDTGATLASALLPGGLDTCPSRRPKQGGAPTLADVDGDGFPEIGVAGCLDYAVFRVGLDPSGGIASLDLLWSMPISDTSSKITGSTFFDLEGDGRVEALYQDHERLWIFDGLTGAVREEFPHSNSTLIEYPALADVDADGRAEIVIVGSDYIRCCDFGVKVLSDPTQPWTPTRTLLNQHAYHQTNVEDDGRIPARERSSWRYNNDYRSQLVPALPPRTDCEPELRCDPGGPYTASCAENTECDGGVELVLEAAEEPFGAPGDLVHRWTIDCAGELQVLEGRVVAACVPVTCEGCAVRLEVGAPGRESRECDTAIEWRFDGPPLTIEAGPDLVVDCPAPEPEPPLVHSACGGPPEPRLEQEIEPGPCPGTFTRTERWFAVDDCGELVEDSRTVEVVDAAPPVLLGVPEDLTVPCDGVPEPAAPSAEDACDPAPPVAFVEEILPGPCPHHFDVLRTWTATDACGNAAEATQTIRVRDLEPPLLVVPEPLVLECTGEGGLPLDDPRIQDWLRSASATDDCTDPVEVSWDAPDFFPVGCPDPAPQVVTFFAEDECGNAVSATSTIEVVDTTPPEILALDLPGCLWSPNHMYACFTDLGELVTAVDACGGGVSVRVEGCSSDQPDEAPEDGDRGGRERGNGDGHHFDDCLVAPDGSGVCVRFERQGTDPEGRHYSLSLVVEDACGNGVAVPWALFVPHDQREHPCPNAKRAERVGPHDPLPWDD